MKPLTVLPPRQSSEEADILVRALFDAVLVEVLAVVAPGAPEGAKLSLSATAVAVECIARSVHIAGADPEHLAMAVGLGFASAVMKRGGEKIYPVMLGVALAKGFAMGVEQLRDMPAPEPETRQ